MLRTRIIVLEAIFGIAMGMALAMPAWASFADDGCTPGFWKQSHHFDQWVQLTPDDSFDDVFGVPSTGITLYEALRAKGGGEGGLQRHAVAAVLNAVSPALNFLLTPDEVIAIVQGGYATGDFESAKNLLELANDEGCPLYQSHASTIRIDGILGILDAFMDNSVGIFTRDANIAPLSGLECSKGNQCKTVT